MYNECSAWDPRKRPTTSEVVSKLEGCENEPLCDDIPLRISQASSLEAFDKDLAKKITAGDSKIQQRMGPANDGTNACAFLCAKLAHDLHMSEERKSGFVQLTLTKLPSLVEKTINELPIEINKVRTSDLCHLDEA